MLMLCAILLPMIAGALLPVWKFPSRQPRQNYAVGAACITSATAVIALFSHAGDDPLILLSLSESMSLALRVDGLTLVNLNRQYDTLGDILAAVQDAAKRSEEEEPEFNDYGQPEEIEPEEDEEWEDEEDDDFPGGWIAC